MKEIIRILGSLVLTTIMYCVPILLTCSICLGWDDSITILLCVLASGQLLELFFLNLAEARGRDT